MEAGAAEGSPPTRSAAPLLKLSAAAHARGEGYVVEAAVGSGDSAEGLCANPLLFLSRDRSALFHAGAAAVQRLAFQVRRTRASTLQH